MFGGLVGIDDRFDQGVRSQPVGAVQPRAGGFSQGIEPSDRGFAVEIDLYAAATVVCRRCDGDQVAGDVDAEREAFS